MIVAKCDACGKTGEYDGYDGGGLEPAGWKLGFEVYNQRKNAFESHDFCSEDCAGDWQESTMDARLTELERKVDALTRKVTGEDEVVVGG